ncbi:DeoR family transcriptional regulator [Clostridium zeae]|uniref:DeoR family transcriptional regulator n=1 Tax=Clostridium zeae TaxID=2759022 RepID=A0ABQ1EC64_9CLOT|nr:YafY family protein [Clostridium zeae]GFZ32088.1 DeoR family transcriptional regulator [Clostridium zeae]
MQISRLFQIIYLLMEKKSITAGELAEKFEVSVRTIYRDIDALCQAGIPIYASQGKGGGISLVDKFVLDKSLLSEKEQDKVLLALQSLSAVQYPELDEVLSKLSRIFKKSNITWIEVDFSEWGSEKNQKEAFSLLKNAILEQLVITFSYFNSNGEKRKRKIEPFKLLFKHKDWYLQGYCLEKEALRTFKINRITNIYITEERCVHQNSKEYTTNSTVEADQEKIKLILKISPEGAYRVYDDFDEENIAKNKDGSYTVSVSMPKGEWIYNYLLSFGTVLEVIEPQSIREEIAIRLNNMLSKYNSKT